MDYRTERTTHFRLKKNYRIHFQLGLITILVILNILLRTEYGKEILTPEIEEIINLTVNEEIHSWGGDVTEAVLVPERTYTLDQSTFTMPSAPPAPELGMKKPEDELIEDIDMDLIPDREFLLDDEYIQPTLQQIESEPDFYLAAHVMPDLRYGNIQDLYSQVVYPEKARREGIEGKVFLQFVVNEDGEVEDPTILRGIGGGCDEAALDALRGTRFTPGLIAGEPVRVKIGLAVKFELNRLTGLPKIMLTEMEI